MYLSVRAEVGRDKGQKLSEQPGIRQTSAPKIGIFGAPNWPAAGTKVVQRPLALWAFG
jgi:hypothetical protein